MLTGKIMMLFIPHSVNGNVCKETPDGHTHDKAMCCFQLGPQCSTLNLTIAQSVHLVGISVMIGLCTCFEWDEEVFFQNYYKLILVIRSILGYERPRVKILD